jgi:hypothetical protein
MLCKNNRYEGQVSSTCTDCLNTSLVNVIFRSPLSPVVCRRLGWSGIIYVICDCLREVVSNTYCVVFLVCLRLVYPVLTVSLECPFLIASLVFSNVYLQLLQLPR